VLAANAVHLPAALFMSVKYAFSDPMAIPGALAGWAVSSAIRRGIARGIFSNEAGLGSAPIAHAASQAKEPVQQGLWGVFEVFVDTIIICALTGLVIVTAGLYGGELKGVPLVMATFSQTFGSFGGIFVSISIVLFAGSTILGWSYYGQQCLGYLTGKNKIWDLSYKAIFSLCAIVGAVGGLTFVWDLADTLNGLMAIPNLFALLLLSKVVVQLTKDYLARQK
jgi:AGCS family alanine or glycine:cation symporter